MIQIIHGDAKSIPYPDDHFDCLVTDPPYGYGFMGKDWDKAVVGVAIWKEVLRVMKPGGFGFIMSAPRQDVLARMIVNLQEAGFETGFTSIYWAYATGFPKAMNVGKAVDKKLGVEREVMGWRDYTTQDIRGNSSNGRGISGPGNKGRERLAIPLTAPASCEAKVLDGAYAGFQPKPAVEVILVVMKPLSEKTYLDQAIKDGKGVTWLDSGRIPYGNDQDREEQAAKNPHTVAAPNEIYGDLATFLPDPWEQPQGRFPANLLVSDDVLDDGSIGVSGGGSSKRSNSRNNYGKYSGDTIMQIPSDTGTFSRYFDLDKWAETLPEAARRTFPFLIVPKASKAEKNQGLAGGNQHPTVKPVKLMSYLITIGSRPGDIILDPFMGSGTTLVAAKALGRRAVGMDNDGGCIPITEARVKAVDQTLFG